MVANNYEYIEDEQELYTLSEAKRELKRRIKEKRNSKQYKKRLRKQKAIALALIAIITTIGIIYQAWAYMTLFLPFLIYVLCEDKIILNV
mgnify:CR=1 FL=1